MSYNISLEGREVFVNLRELETEELNKIFNMAFNYEYYELCNVIQKIINDRNK